MTDDLPLAPHERALFRGHLGANLMHFGRALRSAGLPIGTGQLVDAARAVAAVGVASREDLYWALAACFVRRREELLLFAEAFDLFFRDPFALSRALAALLSRTSIPDPSQKKPDPRSRRVKDALVRPRREAPPASTPREKRLDYDVTMTASAVESLRTRDFEKMTADEERSAREAIRRMKLVELEVPTRRQRADPRGTHLDVRRTLQATLRAGGDWIPLRHRGPAARPPPLVALCDVSGSMERYSRMVLHFLHALSRGRPNVSSFVFGTQLTNVTRWLRERDVDEALAAVGREVTDWSGGTRIGESLRAFNKVWSRRVLAPGAIVLLITDGLERGDAVELGREVERLHKSCGRLVWLNPLLRYAAFEPRAAGVRAILAHVDDFRTVHDLASIEDLARSLGLAGARRGAPRARQTPRRVSSV
jgi:uncharacterized protein with von Willebrand factor type A (vWA) domain